MGWFTRKRDAGRAELRLPTSPTFSSEALAADPELCTMIGRLSSAGAARFHLSATLRPTLSQSLAVARIDDGVGSVMREVLHTPDALTIYTLRSRLNDLAGVEAEATIERALAECAATYNRVVAQLRTAPVDVFTDDAWDRLCNAHEQILDLFTAAQASVSRSVDLALSICARWRALEGLPADTQDGFLADELRQQAQLAQEELATHRAALQQHLPACLKAAQARQMQWLAVRATLDTQQALTAAAQLSAAGLGQAPALDSVAELAALSGLVERHVVGDLHDAQEEIARQELLQQVLKAQAQHPQ